MAPDLFDHRASTSRVLRAAQSALAERRPFSLVRLGDGEGRVLAFPERMSWEDLQLSLHVWFGETHAVTPEQMVDIGQRLRLAIRRCDVLGLPRAFQRDMIFAYKVVTEVCQDENLVAPGAIVCDAAVHHYLQFASAFGPLLRAAARVTVVGPADVRPLLGPAVRWLQTPGEVQHYAPGGGRPHIPDVFETVAAGLASCAPGELALVGAGALGKIYCDLAKQAGAVALDVGSVMDGWVGVRSRVRFDHHPEPFGFSRNMDETDFSDAAIDARVAAMRTLMSIV